MPFGPVLPVLSALLCLYLMTNLAVETWIYFVGWLLIGFLLYFAYGQRHSRLNDKFADLRSAERAARADRLEREQQLPAPEA